MRLMVNAATFTRAIASVSRFAAKTESTPMMARVLIAAEGDSLVLRATDAASAIRLPVPAMPGTVEEGAVALQTDALMRYLRVPVSGFIEISCDDEKIRATLKSDVSQIKLAGMSADGFPQPPDPDRSWLMLSCGEMSGIISRAAAASGSDSEATIKTPHVGALLFDSSDGELKIVATDGKRLAVVSSGIKTDMPSFVMEQRGWTLLKAFCDDYATDTMVSLGQGGNTVSAKVRDAVAVFTKSVTVFPAYRKFTGAIEFRRSVTVDVAAFAPALQRATVAAAGESKEIGLVFRGNSISVVSGIKDCEIEELVPAECDFEDRVSINSVFVSSAVKQIQGDKLTIQLPDSGSPVKFSGNAEADANFFYIAQPLYR